MRIELDPRIEAILQAQVAAGQFASIDDALAAAVLGVPALEEAAGDLTWAVPFLDEADTAIAEGRTLSETEAFADLEKRLGAL
jgi:Arc/MetJ-type ribon-helix-helix transcriptional regulator